MRAWITSFLVATALLAGCGRRAERASFDAQPQPAPSSAPATTQALDPATLRVTWGEIAAPPSEARAGTTLPLTVTFTNDGTATWPDNATASPERPDGRYAVRLSYSWLPTGGAEVQRSADRIDLPRPVAPGESATLPIVVRVPDAAGSYELRIELLQELYYWFADHGAATLNLPVEVRPAAATP